MKKTLSAILLAFLISSVALAADPRTKNLATKLCMFMYDSAGEFKTGDAANLDCELCPFSDGTAPSSCTDANGAETESPASSGNYCVSALAAELNDEFVIMKCASSTSGVPSRSKTFYTKHGTVFTDASGALDTNTIPDKAFTLPQLTAESGTTLTLAASAIAIDDQFNTGFAIAVYDNSKKGVKARSCIVDSTNTGETIVTREDISNLITGAGGSADYYALQSDAGCTSLRPTVAERTVDVTTTGEVGVDLSNVNGTLDDGEVANDITLDNVTSSGAATRKW